MENRVKEKREHYGLSLRELGGLTNSGASTICNIETGKTVPNVILAIGIAKALHTTVEELFGESGERFGDK